MNNYSVKLLKGTHICIIIIFTLEYVPLKIRYTYCILLLNKLFVCWCVFYTKCASRTELWCKLSSALDTCASFNQITTVQFIVLKKIVEETLIWNQNDMTSVEERDRNTVLTYLYQCILSRSRVFSLHIVTDVRWGNPRVINVMRTF